MRKSRVFFGLFFLLAILSRQITGAAGAQVEIFNKAFLASHSTIREHSQVDHLLPKPISNFYSNGTFKSAENKQKETVYKKYKTPDYSGIFTIPNSFKSKQANVSFSLSDNFNPIKPVNPRSQSPPVATTPIVKTLVSTFMGGTWNCGIQKYIGVRGFSLLSCRA